MVAQIGSASLRTSAGVTDGRWHLAGAVGARCPVGAPGAPLELVVRGGTIVALGPLSGDVDGTRPPSRLVLVPLLINAHDHGRGVGNVLAGIADAPLEPWIASLGCHRGVAGQEALVGDACRQMLRSGVGATVLCVNPQHDDVVSEVESAAAAALDAGVRAAVAYPLVDLASRPYGRRRDEVGWTDAEIERRLGEAEAVADQVEGPTIELQLGPVAPHWVSEKALAAIGRHARGAGRRVHIHLLESPAQRVWADSTYPEGLVSFLERVDLLGPHVCFAHGTQLRAQELEAIAASGAVLAMNASSNLRLASGFPPAATALEEAGALAAGLDGLSLGDDGDYWTELRLLRGIAQAQSGVTLGAASLLDRCWRGGRQALGDVAPGPPEEGEAADFVLLDLGDHLHLVEHHGWSFADVVLAAASPERVAEVWVGGRRIHPDTSRALEAVSAPTGTDRSSQCERGG